MVVERYPYMMFAGNPDLYSDSRNSATSSTKERNGSVSLW